MRHLGRCAYGDDATGLRLKHDGERVFEWRTPDDVRAIVQPSLENEFRFATARRVSEINLGLYRSLFPPFVQAFASTQTAEWLHKLNPSELPFELFSDRNPLMQRIAQLAEWLAQVEALFGTVV